jgi:cell division protein FtsW (lipid II flippase)
MSVTYTTAAQRDAHRARARVSYTLPDPLLAATSFVAALAIALATAGRLRAFDAGERGRQVVNVNAVSDPGALEPALANLFPNAHDRRFAATELFRFLGSDGAQRRTLPNVGAIARATVSTKSIRDARNLEVFAERLRSADDGARPADVDDRVALFTSADVSNLKPWLSVRTRDEFRSSVWFFAVLYVVAFQTAAFLLRRRRVPTDSLLLVTAHLLTAIGFAVLLSRPDPLRDTLLFERYAETIVVGLVVMTAVSMLDLAALEYASLSYLPLLAALGLSMLLIVFGTGPGNSSAKVNLGPVQPIEGIRLLLALFLAGYFGRRWELLREVRGDVFRDVRLPKWMNLPRGEYILPVLTGVAAALAFFFLQRDLGPALFLCCVFLAVYAVARGRVGMAITGLLLLVSGFYIGYRLQVSATLADRVRIWQSPWDNAVGGGDQITHAFWALATGGPFGTGLGLGDTRYLPAGHTDLILAAVGEELGAMGLVVVAALFTLLAWRGFRIARRASSDYGFFLATSLTLFLILPALIMASGVLGVTPLTGVVTPFLSYGGSAMLANFAALGFLAAIRSDRGPANDFAPFRLPMRYLSGILGACALALIAVVIRVQVLGADELVVRPHLGIHADGGRRFEYNPRIVDIIQSISRGTIYDRRGLPLASGDAQVLASARKVYERWGIFLDRICPKPDDRCYPLAGETIHVLGDARSATNWSAANTSYLERDADTRLRGFDDHSSTVRTFDRAGRTMYTVLRDYRELVPVLRHRYQPQHAAMVAFRDRPRDVRATLDADLQHRVAAIVATYARKAKGSAAALVLDPDTGAILASVSYPWPLSLEDVPPAVERDAEGGDPWLDRARYGGYPPGSTFKLLVALAALRDGRDAARFTCSRLPDGRVGTRIAGWTRPVRDDVLDTHPHATLDMHDALVHSCNAYFAQLAVGLGPAPLAALAARVKIPLSPSGASAQAVRDLLPQIGYGQGQVVASPLRMASLAGAIAADGLLRTPYIDEAARPATPGEVIADPSAARRLASYMRDVVLSGTGRVLRDRAVAIAGKTGTAEISRRDSHAWFVGFAPYEPSPVRPKRRIAFAIVIEHAGYGSATAAPAAGDIVDAAVRAGLIGK